MRPARLILPLAAALVAVSAPAAHATRYAAPDSTLAAPCTLEQPCKLSAAIATASSGETVILAPGDYVTSAGISPGMPIHIEGQANAARPRIVGSSRLVTTLMSIRAGGSLKRLHLQATGPGDALTLSSGLGEDLVIASAAGDGAKVNGSLGTTVLRDSIVRTQATTSDKAALKLRDGAKGGDVALVNVTAIATAGQAEGILCETNVGTSTIVNSIVAGGPQDIDASKAPGTCLASSSLFRAAASPGVAADATNRDGDPRFTAAAAGNYRPAAGGPGIDAGVADARLGLKDLDGRARTLAGAPDMGAYEYDASDPPSTSDPTQFPPAPVDAISGEPVAKPTTGDAEPAQPTTTPPPATDAPQETPADQPAAPLPIVPAVTPPAIGRSVVLKPARGSVVVRLPGTARAIPLDAAASLPVGTVIDATHGAVTLTSAIGSTGRTQTGTFHGGAFVARQSRTSGGMVDIVLSGGDFGACRRATARSAAADGPVAFAAGRRKAAVRRLWGKDSGGRFRTKGRNSVATVRGTRWLTVDRCDGTLTKVTEGAVVVRDRRTGRRKLVRAGGRHLVRAKAR